jgi:heptosyltransferase III
MDMDGPRILVFKLNFLGDAIAFLPTVSAVRRIFPRASVDVVCTERTESIFSKSVFNIRTISVPRDSAHGVRGPMTVPKIARRLGRLRYDFALLSHDEPSFAYLLAAASLSRRRVGFDLINRHLRFLLSDVLHFEHGRSIVDLNFDLIRHISGQRTLRPTRVAIGYDAADVATVERRLLSIGLRTGTDFVVLHPFAKLRYREWGIRNYMTVARELTTRDGIPTVLVSETDPSELRWPLTLCGLSVHELAVLFERARLFVGNNSGPMHIAAAMGTPTRIPQGPSAPEWNVPWIDAPHRRAIATHLACVPCERVGRIVGYCANDAYPGGCMLEISPELLLTHARQMLAGLSASERPSPKIPR